MKQILIVLNDTVLLSLFQLWSSRCQKTDGLFLAQNAEEAVAIIKSNPIDLFLTELKSDNLELLAVISSSHSELETVILMPAIPNPTETEIKELTSFDFTKRPDTLKDFINMITVVEDSGFHPKSIAKMKLSDFFQLIAIHKKTCLLGIETASTPKKATVYFEQGVLYDATCGDAKAEAAMLEILQWNSAKIAFKNLANNQIPKQIQADLNELIIAANQPKTENVVDVAIDTVSDAPVLPITLPTELPATTEPEIETTAIAEPLEITAEIIPEITPEITPQIETQPALPVQSLNISQAELEEILKPLHEIDDYLASAIFDRAGSVFMTHNISDYNIEVIVENVVSLIKTAIATMNSLELGKSNFLQINCDDSIFEAVWIEEAPFAVAVLLNTNAKSTGLARMKLTKMTETIHAQLS